MQSPSDPTGKAGATPSPASRFLRRAGVAALSAVYLVQSVALGLTPAQAQVSPPSSGQASGQ
ncbi:hypothetical protein, partial [Pannonibacter tanglangensis]|uniref:hypothetical protein n=1 Tax=Pannonibacter tanglangensis TaxID=2750084 RepID=UPI001AD8A91B